MLRIKRTNNIRLLSLDDENKTVEVDINLEGFENQINDLVVLVKDFAALLNEQLSYINELKTRLLIKPDSTNLVAPNGTTQLSVNDNYIFKRVTNNWEVLPSENWVVANYFNKTDLTNYTANLRLGPESRWGKSESQDLYLDYWSTSEVQLKCSNVFFKFQNAANSILFLRDKEVKVEYDDGNVRGNVQIR